MDQLLVVGPSASQSVFEQLKAEPGAPGVKNLQKEIAELQTLRALGVPADALTDMPWKVLRLLKRRAQNDHASKMREHPPTIRCALLACFVGVRTMEVIDDVVRMMPEIMRRIATQTEKPLSCAGCKAGVELGSCLTTAG